VGNVTGTASFSSSGQYHGPLNFQNKSGNYMQVRRPSSTSSSGAYAYVNPGPTYGTNQVFCFVYKQLTDGSAKYWMRNRNKSTGTLTQTYSGSTFSYNSSSPSFGMKTSADVARPAFNDSIYWGDMTNLNLVGAGFGNRAYTDAECNDLVEWLDTNYAV
jgi:hypothetical protein